MAMKSQTQRTLLLGFIGSISCCGLVGIYCLIIGRMGQFEAKVLATTGIVGAASILGLASAIPWERRRWHPLGPLAMSAVGAALALVLILIWAELAPSRWEWFYKLTGVAGVFGVALPHAGLLSLARLRPQYEQVRFWTILAIVLLAGQIILSIITEPSEDLWYRLMGVLSIAVVCGTIAVPILHRVSAIRTREAVRTVELSLSLTCPRCGKAQELPVGRSKCAACGLMFSIEIEEAICRVCGYPLYQLKSDKCPECGTPIAQDAAQP
jgi:MFS family permease